MTNPWITEGPDVKPPPKEQPLPAPSWTTGAKVNVTGGLPIVPTSVGEPGFLWVIGAHGGAGTTTMAKLLNAGDAGTSWPHPLNPQKALIVARSNYSGLRAAQKVAIQWVSGEVPAIDLVGLIIVPDSGGKRPKELRDLTRLVSGAFPAVFTLEWVEKWRTAEPWDVPVSREIARQIIKINNQIGRTSK